MSRILLVEDHARLAESIRFALERDGMACDVVSTQRQAVAAMSDARYAALILDRTLPDGDGLKLLGQLRALRDGIPCMILTARDGLSDRVDGLEAGADDYLTKPFELEELLARARALLRRAQTWLPSDVVFHDLRIVPQTSTMQVADSRIVMSSTELQILMTLARHEGKVVRRGTLETAAWGLSTAVTPKALDVAVHRLRGKLAALGSELAIFNSKGIGYALAIREDE
jgi:DNA-binding response OmpR family regulator